MAMQTLSLRLGRSMAKRAIAAGLAAGAGTIVRKVARRAGISRRSAGQVARRVSVAVRRRVTGKKLKFGSPAWRKKYAGKAAAGRRKAAKARKAKK